MSLREKSIQMANESADRAEATRKKIEEGELKQLREAFNKKFGEYPDSVWKVWPNFFASKEGLTFKLIFATGNISDGISYFYITNSEHPYGHLSEKLDCLLDLGRYLRLREGQDFSQVKQVEMVGQVEHEPEPKYDKYDRDKPKRMLRLNENG